MGNEFWHPRSHHRLPEILSECNDRWGDSGHVTKRYRGLVCMTSGRRFWKKGTCNNKVEDIKKYKNQRTECDGGIWSSPRCVEGRGGREWGSQDGKYNQS